MSVQLPVPANEEARLQALLDYNVLDTLPEDELDGITKLASFICQTPIALISLIDGERQWFKSKVGLAADETEREISFCQYAIMDSEIFEVPNALEDKRFKENPLVTGNPDIRFYAGVPLENPDGFNMGSLCVIDTVPRKLTTEQREALKVLSKQVIIHFELRKKNRQLHRDQEELKRNREMLQVIATATDELLSTSDYMLAISRCLPKLGKAVGADYNFLFQNKIDEHNEEVTSQLLRWQIGAAESEKGRTELQNKPVSLFGTSFEKMRHNQVVEVLASGLDASSELRKLMEAQQSKSFVMTPVFLKKTLWGFVGYGENKYERKWNEAETSLLKSFANSIANAIDRAETAKEAHSMALFPLENPEPVFRVNLKGEMILKNQAAEQITYFDFDGRRYAGNSLFAAIAGKLSQQNPVLSLEAGNGEKVYAIVARLLEYNEHINIYTSDITHQKKTERELERLSMVAKSNSKGVLFINLDGQVSWCNDGFTNLTHYNRKEVYINTAFDLLSGPRTQPDLLEKVRHAFLNGESIETELILYRQDQSFFWSKIKLQPLTDETGQLKEFYAMLEDIDDQKKAEELLRESEIRMSAIIQNLHSGILLKDENRRVVILNKQFYKLFKLSETDIAPGDEYVKITEILKKQFKKPEAYKKRIDQILEQSEVVVGEELELADGRCFERDYIPIYIDNKYKGHLWKYTDITLRKNYERNLKSQEEKYRSIITNMNLGFIEVDMEGVIKNANLTFCKDSGYQLPELTGRRATQILGIENSLQEQVSPQVLLDIYRLPVQNKRGELRWWLMSGAPNFNDKGLQTGFILINLDITEHKQLEEALLQAKQRAEESSRAKERFFANMSHEIRTPLNAIIGMVKELSREKLTQKQKLYVHHASSASQHLLSLVNNILDLSKIGEGELHLEKRAFSLRDVINDTAAIMSPAAKEKLLYFDVTVSDEIAPAFNGDSNRIRQILINLISNAVKFTDNGGISISCVPGAKTKAAQQVNLTISDTGIGMEEAYLKDIFKQFTQEDISTARKYGGTGLGMSITYELVQLMNGSIQVYSSKGNGTRVEVSINFDIADEREITPAPVAERVEILRNKKILLVEDNELNRMVANNTLKRFGVLITEAINGQEAINKIKNFDFDLILMDLQMPVMDGITATKIIRQELQVTTPIIAFTANAFKNEMDKHLANGMDGYVTKPFEENVLISTVQKALLKAEEQTDNANETKLYNLEKLIEISHGDTGFVKRMLSVFAEHTTASVQEIKTALQEKDFETIRKVAHRIKPSIEKLDIVVLQQDIRFIEHFNPAVHFDADLQDAVFRLETVTKKVIEALAEEEI